MRRLRPLAYGLAAVVAFLTLSFPPAARAQDRIALVVGNDRYQHLPADKQLRKAVNDARAMGEALRRLGYKVILGENLSRQEMVDKLFSFTREIKPGDTALMFFAGHGVAIAGGNYLLPSDVRPAQPGEEARVRNMALGEADIVADIQERKARVAVLVLDACRDNPFRQPGILRSAGAERGLARAREAEGVFAVYSAGFGQTALDSLGADDSSPNSVFTRVLAPALARADAHLGELIIDVREEVSRLARSVGHQQSPAYYDQTQGGRVYLAPRVTPTAPQGSANVAALPPPASAAAAAPAQPPPATPQPSGTRPWLGVRIQQVTDEIADSLGMKPARGALIAGVDENGPAKPAGMQSGDVIVRYDGKDIKEFRELPPLVAQTPIGKTVAVVVVRKGKEETLAARLGQMSSTTSADERREPEKKPEPEKNVATAPSLPPDSPFKEFFKEFFERRDAASGSPPVVARKVLGMDLTAITPVLRERLKIKDSVRGVAIAGVEQGSPADGKNLKPGDVIVELASAAVADPADLAGGFDRLKRDGKRTALLLVANPAGELRFVALPLQ